MTKDYTLVLLKPSAVERGICGQIISRYEQGGLQLVKMKLGKFPRESFTQLYAEHRGKPFYEKIVSAMSSAPIIAIVLAGPTGVVEKVRSINGATDPVKAAPGTIRGDFAAAMDPDNVVHASDSVENAQREIAIFYPEFVRSNY